MKKFLICLHFHFYFYVMFSSPTFAFQMSVDPDNELSSLYWKLQQARQNPPQQSRAQVFNQLDEPEDVSFKPQLALTRNMNAIRQELAKTIRKYEDSEKLQNRLKSEGRKESSEIPHATNMGQLNAFEAEKDRKSNKTIPNQNSCRDDTFVGTNLFGGCRKKCFSAEDVALLALRRDLEILIPKNIPEEFLDDKKVGLLMKYFCQINKVIQTSVTDDARRLAQKALYDTLGGYLRYTLLPTVKAAFYAGKVNLKTIENVEELYHQSKVFLNTNGNGWRHPTRSFETYLQPGKIKPILIPQEIRDASSCTFLDLYKGVEESQGFIDPNMIVPLPKLEVGESGILENIILPFKNKKVYNLRLPTSSAVLLNYFTNVIKCYNFQHLPHDTFSRRFKEWILENIFLHLYDEEFYPGLDSILRIYETLLEEKSEGAKTKLEDINHDENLLDDEIKICKNDFLPETAIPKKKNKVSKRHRLFYFKKKEKPAELPILEKLSQKTLDNDEDEKDSSEIWDEQDDEEAYESPNEEQLSDELTDEINTLNENNVKARALSYFHFQNPEIERQVIMSVTGSGIVFVMGGLIFLVYRQLKSPESSSKPNQFKGKKIDSRSSKTSGSKTSRSLKGSRPKYSISADLEESSSRLLCQLPRKCIPLPYSNIGGRMAKANLTYYTTDTESDETYDKTTSRKAFKKRSGGGGDGTGYDESSWTTTYMFHK